jgi:hypothetical protein
MADDYEKLKVRFANLNAENTNLKEGMKQLKNDLAIEKQTVNELEVMAAEYSNKVRDHTKAKRRKK